MPLKNSSKAVAAKPVVVAPTKNAPKGKVVKS